MVFKSRKVVKGVKLLYNIITILVFTLVAAQRNQGDIVCFLTSTAKKVLNTDGVENSLHQVMNGFT